MKPLPSLNALRAFEAASRHMSFMKAANELNVTPSALSYQIRQLEDYLQIELFIRGNRQVHLTPAGQRIKPGVALGFDHLRNAMEELQPQRSNNILTVTSGPAFGAKWLAPRMHHFIERFPQFEIRLSASVELSDLTHNDIDVAIRFGAGGYENLHVEVLTGDGMLPLISPQLLKQYDGKFGERELAQTTLLHDDSTHFIKHETGWAAWLKHAGFKGIDATRGIRFSHADHALEAALDGAGIVTGRLLLAMRDIAAGRLVAPFNIMIQPRARFHFCCLAQSLHLEKIQAFRTFIYEEIERDRCALEDFSKTQHLVD